MTALDRANLDDLASEQLESLVSPGQVGFTHLLELIDAEAVSLRLG